jgi:hypothetical protein
MVVIGGTFNEFNGQPCNKLIGWDAANAYETFPGLFTDSLILPRALSVFQGDLIAAGNMNGDTRVMRWDGNSWAILGGSFSGAVLEFTVYNGQLIAAGNFTGYDGAPLNRVAGWDGTNWISMGGGFDDEVRALEVHNDTLFSGGRFRNSGDGAIDLERIAYWNGVDWAPVSSGLNGKVTDLMSTVHGLWITGSFTYDMDSTIALAGTCSHNVGYSSFPLPPMPYGATLIHSDQFGDGISGNGSSWFGDGAEFRRTGCWNIDWVVGINGYEFTSGTFLSTPGYTEWGIAMLVPGASHSTIDAAGVRSGLLPNSLFYTDITQGMSAYTIPTNSNAPLVYAMGPCAAASSNGSIHASRPSLSNVGPSGFWPGPMCSDTSESFLNEYLQVWNVDKGMIWDHLDHFNDPGYMTPYTLESWPANGDTQNGEAARLSPFHDLDSDGIYEPAEGECPLIRGDREIHFILSSRYPEPNWPLPAELELAVTAYAYDTQPGDTTYHTSFLNLKYINRSAEVYDTLLLGFLIEIDLGCYYDDYIGCDTLLSMAFGFNGDAFDEDCGGVPGHGGHSPSFGVVSLNSPLHSFSLLGSSQNLQGPPMNSASLYERLLGRWNDGTPITVSCSNDPSAAETRYMYSSDVGDVNGFCETGCNNYSGDRRFISSYGPFLNVAPGDTICLDLALIFAQDTLGDNFTSVSLLKQKAAAVKAWYDQSGLSCTQDVALGMPTTARPLGSLLSIAPNPATDLARITLGATAGGELRVLTPTGQVIRSQRYAAHTTALELDLAGLPNGTYLLQTVEPKEIRCGRLVVLH